MIGRGRSPLLPAGPPSARPTQSVPKIVPIIAPQNGFSAALQGKHTGRRYFTCTNDQSFGGYTTLDLGLGYDFGVLGPLKGAKLSPNVTNLTDNRYTANFDSSVLAPNDPAGTIIVFHSLAP
jgi:iron complex outermembrane receptor protein